MKWLIQIEQTFGRRSTLIVLGLFEKLLKFAFPDLFTAQMRSEALFENVIPPVCFALQLLDGCVQIFNCGLLFRLAMLDYGVRLYIDLQSRSAARAGYIERPGCLAGHTGIVAQKGWDCAACYPLTTCE